MTQFYSRNDVNYSGDVYSIPFDYIDKKEVKVYIDDELWTKWHFLSEHQLTLDEVPEDIRYSNIISVRRETDIEDKVVTYDNNSLLNKENLNKSQDQLLFAVQEIYDNNVQFQSDIREEVDEKVERVSDAVEKLEFLEDSVEIANEAALEATEQAQIATEKAEETLQTYETAMNDIDNLRADCIDGLNSLDATIKKDADAIINRVGLNMFDTVVKDHVLTYPDGKGLALQGTWVYKNAVAGERYGYPDFYNKVVQEYAEARELGVKQITLGGSSINVHIHPNGHIYYTADSGGVNAVNTWFNTFGHAWFYGLDTTNSRVLLPRNVWFEQMTNNSSQVGLGVDAGLPNITGKLSATYSITGGAVGATGTGAFRATNGTITSGQYNVKSANGCLSYDLNAARSSSVYGGSTTVQPKSVKKLLYICVGNQIQDSSWVNVVTQVKNGAKDIEDKRVQALTDLTNKENEGLSALANASNALRETQITNCLKEVPQNIKLELADGVLTLKAGSKVIVPNGVGVFKELIISKDLTLGTIGTATLPSKLYVKADGSALVQWVNEASGATVPASGTSFGFYNTSDNTCKLYNTEGTAQHTVSFPIANVHRTSGSWDKIEQVFNGFGYIGSHIWMDKGVKVLVANGINDDGTIKNEEIVTPNVIVARGLASGTRSDFIPFLRKYPTNNQLQIYPINKTSFLGELDYVPTVGSGFQWYFNTQVMKWYMHEAGATEWVSAPYYNISPTITVVNNVITSFKPYKIFRAADNNMLQIVESYTNGFSGYRVWSDGFIEQWGKCAEGNIASVTLIKNFTNTNYQVHSTCTLTTDKGVGGRNYIAANKTVSGFNCKMGYANATTMYAFWDGANQWYAFGY